MARFRIRIEERAEEEARAAFRWYLVRNPRAAERFQCAVEECIDVIAEAPDRYPEIEPGVRRRLLLHRFPYAVIYRTVDDEVQIVGVMHLRRLPGYWRT